MLLPKKEKNNLRPNTDEQKSRQKPITLVSCIDSFINWYTFNFVKGNYTPEGEKHEPEILRNFIEKMSVWYELRYPDYEINRLMPGFEADSKDISNIMFNENPYVNEQLDSNNEARILEWSKFFNKETFIKSLPSEEQFYLRGYIYPSIVYWNRYRSFVHIHLNSDGIIEMSELMSFILNGIEDKDLEGKHFNEIIEMINNQGIEIPEESEFRQVMMNSKKFEEFKNRLLDCVMYRIIERGGNRVGARRAFLFAKEFDRDIKVPMIYGIDTSDPGLRNFLNEYIKAGGKTDLRCYLGYSTRISDSKTLSTKTIADLLKNTWHNYLSFYTPEEIELQKRLINNLKNRLEVEKNNRKAEIDALRLERKLAKSRTNKNKGWK